MEAISVMCVDKHQQAGKENKDLPVRSASSLQPKSHKVRTYEKTRAVSSGPHLLNLHRRTYILNAVTTDAKNNAVNVTPMTSGCLVSLAFTRGNVVFVTTGLPPIFGTVPVVGSSSVGSIVVRLLPRPQGILARCGAHVIRSRERCVNGLLEGSPLPLYHLVTDHRVELISGSSFRCEAKDTRIHQHS